MNIKDDIIIIAILITLLEIRIVANNILGDSISLIISLWLRNDEALNLFLSDGDKPKNAISEPEIKPEPINKNRHDKKGVKKL